MTAARRGAPPHLLLLAVVALLATACGSSSSRPAGTTPRAAGSPGSLAPSASGSATGGPSASALAGGASSLPSAALSHLTNDSLRADFSLQQRPDLSGARGLGTPEGQRLAAAFRQIALKGTEAAESAARRQLTIQTPHPASVVLFDGAMYLVTAQQGSRQVSPASPDFVKSVNELGAPATYLSGLMGTTDEGTTSVDNHEVRHLRGSLSPQALPGYAQTGRPSPFAPRASQIDLYIERATGRLLRLVTHLELAIDLGKLGGAHSPISGTAVTIIDSAWHFHDYGAAIKVDRPVPTGTAAMSEVTALLTGAS